MLRISFSDEDGSGMDTGLGEDTEAFRAFYVANAGRVVAFFRRRTPDADLALDLAAETFAIALARRHQFRGAGAAEAEGWLFAIARSVLVGHWRRGFAERRALELLEAQRPAVAGGGELERVEELAGLPELRGRVQAAMAGLCPQQAYAVLQRVVAERGYAELAAELGVSQDVVRARVSRGLRALAATDLAQRAA
jgi:RNA polymerase sigma-70 factor (ECF subfamily)